VNVFVQAAPAVEQSETHFTGSKADLFAQLLTNYMLQVASVHWIELGNLMVIRLSSGESVAESISKV
jgi:hypothetical protein